MDGANALEDEIRVSTATHVPNVLSQATPHESLVKVSKPAFANSSEFHHTFWKTWEIGWHELSGALTSMPNEVLNGVYIHEVCFRKRDLKPMSKIG